MEFKRQIAIGDIHGCFEVTVALVEKKIVFDPENDKLIFIGDYIDRGPDSMKVVSYIAELKKKYPQQVVLLAGNHEFLAFEAFKHRTTNQVQLWFINGGISTIQSYGSYENAQSALLPFVETLEPYHEIDEAIFVHGGIPIGDTITTATPKSLLWERNYAIYKGKNIIVGHTPHKKVTKYKHAVVIDTGAVFYGKLSGYDVLNDKIYEAVDETIAKNPRG